MVQIPKGELLDLADNLAPQVSAHGLGDSHRKHRVGNGKQGAEDGRTEHQQGSAQDHLHILLCDSLVDDPLGQARNQQV